MSNYLGRLAARALGEADGVRPRLPSLFETAPTTPMLEADRGGHAPPSDVDPWEQAAFGIEEPERHDDAPALRPPRTVDSAPVTAPPAADIPLPLPRRAERRDEERGGVPRERGRADTPDQAPPARERPGVAREEVAAPMGDSSPAVVVERVARDGGPTVRVTIGRIEVRAVVPAAPRPAPARPRPAPRLTLDDYVRLRDEGKR